MGRDSIWSDEEDALLLGTAGQPAVEVNEQLVAAGFATRTPDQIKRRRNYLVRRKYQHALRVDSGSEPEVELLAALQRRRQLTSELAATEAQLLRVNQRIHELLPEVQEQLGQD